MDNTVTHITMKYIFSGFVIVFLLFVTSFVGNIKNADDSKQMTINRNYMFCVCLNLVNSQNNLSDFSRRDGSTEVYFIDSLLVIDTEDAIDFAQMYLDSLKRIDAYRSYNNNSLGICKCLDLYNSQKLNDYVKKRIKE